MVVVGVTVETTIFSVAGLISNAEGFCAISQHIRCGSRGGWRRGVAAGAVMQPTSNIS